MSLSRWAVVLASLTAAGCGRETERPEVRADTAEMMEQADSAGGGMDAMRMQGSMMLGMRAHMDSMMGMSPDRMSGMMAAHERMMSQMMDRMGADMRGMNMRSDVKWDALTDSVKTDLADLPSLKGPELLARMKAHSGRVQRLIDMHEGMMKGIVR